MASSWIKLMIRRLRAMKRSEVVASTLRGRGMSIRIASRSSRGTPQSNLDPGRRFALQDVFGFIDHGAQDFGCRHDIMDDADGFADN